MSDEYMVFCCNDIEHLCNFRIQARTRDAVEKYARAHLAGEHGRAGRDIAKRVEAAVRPIKIYGIRGPLA